MTNKPPYTPQQAASAVSSSKSTTTYTSPSASASAIHRPAHLTQSAALTATAAASAKANEIGVPMNIAIMDASLYLLHFTRMPKAKLTSVDIAINKAFTAAGHRVATSSYKAQVTPGNPAYGLSIAGANGGRFTYVAGGVPIVIDGEVVGAVGCSTGTPAQDEECAKAGVEAVMELVKGGGDAPLKARL